MTNQHRAWLKVIQKIEALARSRGWQATMHTLVLALVLSLTACGNKRPHVSVAPAGVTVVSAEPVSDAQPSCSLVELIVRIAPKNKKQLIRLYLTEAELADFAADLESGAEISALPSNVKSVERIDITEVSCP